MKVASIVALYGVRLRAKCVQELVALLGVAIGVALLYASRLLDTRLADPVAGAAGSSTELLSAIGTLVGLLLAFNAILLTAPQRRKLVADLRLDGYTPREVVEVLLFDALALGLLGSLGGVLLGDALARNMLDGGAIAFAHPLPSGWLSSLSLSDAAVALAAGLLAACVGVLSPARGIFARRPLAFRTASGPTRTGTIATIACGVACLGVTTAILIAGIDGVALPILAFASLLAALLLLLPSALVAKLAAFDSFHHVFRCVSSHIALAELRSSATRARSLAVAATAALAVFSGVVTEGARRNLHSSLVRGGGEAQAAPPLGAEGSARRIDIASARSQLSGQGRLTLAVHASAAAGSPPAAASADGWVVLARLTRLAALLRIAAVFALAAAMATMIWQRRARLAGMKVDGFDRGELLRVLLCESLLLLAGGCSSGVLFGLYGQLVLARSLDATMGLPVVFSPGAPVAVTSFALAASVAVAIVVVSGYVAARVRPALPE